MRLTASATLSPEMETVVSIGFQRNKSIDKTLHLKIRNTEKEKRNQNTACRCVLCSPAVLCSLRATQPNAVFANAKHRECTTNEFIATATGGRAEQIDRRKIISSRNAIREPSTNSTAPVVVVVVVVVAGRSRRSFVFLSTVLITQIDDEIQIHVRMAVAIVAIACMVHTTQHSCMCCVTLAHVRCQ